MSAIVPLSCLLSSRHLGLRPRTSTCWLLKQPIVAQKWAAVCLGFKAKAQKWAEWEEWSLLFLGDLFWSNLHCIHIWSNFKMLAGGRAGREKGQNLLLFCCRQSFLSQHQKPLAWALCNPFLTKAPDWYEKRLCHPSRRRNRCEYFPKFASYLLY